MQKQALRKLAEVDAELAYLALLTTRGIKPLSRWEKTLPEDAAVGLASLQLQVRAVSRRVERGLIIETVFSRSPVSIRWYTSRFQNEPVNRTPAVVRIEGFLFGYPGCCVEAFLSQPYGPNSLSRSDQRILFHWACPGCVVTPLMLPSYRRAHDIIEELHPGFETLPVRRKPQR